MLPRATRYYFWKLNDAHVGNWRVDFDCDWTEMDLFKAFKAWGIENCEGTWEEDFHIAGSGYASFLKKEDALMCYLRFR